MIKISTHPAGEKVYEVLKELFNNGAVYLSPHQHLSFVCGKKSGESGSLRTNFIDFLNANPNLHSILPIVAEQAIDEFLSSDETHQAKPDLGEFEHLIGDCVDSILIFPESPGSFAELGFFAGLEKIRNKTLVVNQNVFQRNSFINLGIIPLYNTNSTYNPMLVIGGNTDLDFGNIIERLQLKKGARIYRKRFSFETFDKLSNKNQLIVLHELIRAFGFITEQNLFDGIHIIFKKYDLTKIKRLLAILVAMKFVSRNDNGDYLISKGAPPLLEYDDDSFDKAQVSTLNFYQTNDPEALMIIEKIQ